MAFKSNSVPEFVQQHSYSAEIPGLDLTDGVTFARRAPSVFIGAAAKPWTSIDPGDIATANAVWQANANADWQTIFALRGLIALLNCAAPGFRAFGVAGAYADEWNHSGATPANLIDLGALSGSGTTITADYVGDNPITAAGGIQLPCWLYLSYSKLSGRVLGIVYAITDAPEESGGVLTLHLIRPIGNRALEASGGTIGAQLMGFTGAAKETWSSIGPTSDPRVELERLINNYPWLLEVQIVGDPDSKLLTRAPGEGHPSLNSLVYGVPPAVGNNFQERDYHQSGAFSGGWSKRVSAGGMLSSAYGFERLRTPGSGYGPAGNLRASNAIGWGNFGANSDTDPQGRCAASLLRGLSSMNLYDHGRGGKSAPWVFARTWLGAAGITSAAGVQQFHDFWVETGHFDSQGQTVEAESEADVCGRKLRIVHGLQGYKVATEKALPVIGSVTLGHYEFLEEGFEIAGSNVKAHLAHPLVNVAKDGGTGEDVIEQHRGAGMTVMIVGDTDDVGWSNWACPLSVSGQGGRGLEAGHCLVVPSIEGIPEHLRGRLLPIVRAEAGAGNEDANWDGGILDSGIAGQPAGYATFADKMDCVWLWKDAADTFGQLVLNYVVSGGPNPASMTFGVVRGARICAVHGVYPVAAGSLGSAIEVVNWLPDGTILLAHGNDAALAVDCEQYLEQVPLSISGDPILKAAEAIFENGRDFTTPISSITADGTEYSLKADWSESGWGGEPTGDIPGVGYVWIEGNNRFTYTETGGSGTRTIIGATIDGETPQLSSGAIYYNPNPGLTCDALGGLGLGGSEVISEAWANVTVDDPALSVQTYTFDGLGGFAIDNDTDPAPELTVGAIGVNLDSGVYTSASLATGEGLGMAAADGVEHEVDFTDQAKAIADNYDKYDCIAFYARAAGFTVDAGEALDMKSVMVKIWKEFYQRDLEVVEGQYVGTVTAKHLEYDALTIDLCHAAYLPAEFQLPAGCRV